MVEGKKKARQPCGIHTVGGAIAKALYSLSVSLFILELNSSTEI